MKKIFSVLLLLSCLIFGISSSTGEASGNDVLSTETSEYEQTDIITARADAIDQTILLADELEASVYNLNGTHASDCWFLADGMCRNGSDGLLSVSAEDRTASEWGFHSWTLKYNVPYRIWLGNAAVLVNGENIGVVEAKLQDYNLWLTKDEGISRAEFLLYDIPAKGDRFSINLPLSTQTGDLYYIHGELKDSSFSWPSDGNIDTLKQYTYRVLRWDESGEENCLVYAGLTLIYNGEEMEIELLLSAPLNTPDNLVLLSDIEGESSSNHGSDSNSSGDSGVYTPPHAKLDCLTCGGSGRCTTCGGYGKVERYQGAGNTVSATCPSCYGSRKCRTCHGSGKRN